MTKADLIDEVSRLTELTRKDSEVIVETIFESVVRSLRAGDKIEIRGFGSFRTRQRKPRVGRNPKTGDRVEYEMGMPLSLQPVDPENPQIVALRRGPLALFGTGNLPATFSRAQLLAATAASPSSEDWLVQGDAGKITFRPFAAINDEPYRLYHTVKS